MLETANYDCPYCGEEVETTVDLSGGDQEYIEGLPGVLQAYSLRAAGSWRGVDAGRLR